MAKTPACSLYSLTVGKLSKTGVFRPGDWWQGRLLMRNGFSVNVQADAQGIRLYYGIRQLDGVVKRQVKLAWMWLQVGFGIRAYFCCPLCGKRCGKIFLNFGRWSCKRCAEACSDYENDSHFFRRVAKLEKLKQKLGIKGRQAFISKPKGMHWKTYRRLYAQALAVYQECTLAGSFFAEHISKTINKDIH